MWLGWGGTGSFVVGVGRWGVLVVVVGGWWRWRWSRRRCRMKLRDESVRFGVVGELWGVGVSGRKDL